MLYDSHVKYIFLSQNLSLSRRNHSEAETECYVAVERHDVFVHIHERSFAWVYASVNV